MLKTALTIAILALTCGTGLAADLDSDQKRELDRHVMRGDRGYVEAPVPYFAAPPMYYRKKVTTRTCIDDGDGITCHYDRYSVQ